MRRSNPLTSFGRLLVLGAVVAGVTASAATAIPVVDPQDSQLRVQARARPTTAFAGVVDNGVVGGVDPEDQATEQADAAGALLG